MKVGLLTLIINHLTQDLDVLKHNELTLAQTTTASPRFLVHDCVIFRPA